MSDSATPQTVARQAPLSMKFFRQEYGSVLPFPSPGDHPNPVIKSQSPELQADVLPAKLLGKPCSFSYWKIITSLSGYYYYSSSIKQEFINKLFHLMVSLKAVIWRFWWRFCYQGKCLCFSVQGYMRKYFNKTQKRNYCLLQQFEILPNIIL